MKLSRSVIRITVRDSIESEKIREKLKTKRTVKDTQQYGNSWHGYANYVPRIFLLSSGKTRIDHLRSRWKGHFI
jgi:predicted type IV restriction endonuclease